MLCRDLLPHLPIAAIRKVLDNIRISGARYLLTTTYPSVENHEVAHKGLSGGWTWRPSNLEAEPFGSRLQSTRSASRSGSPPRPLFSTTSISRSYRPRDHDRPPEGHLPRALGRTGWIAIQSHRCDQSIRATSPPAKARLFDPSAVPGARIVVADDGAEPVTLSDARVRVLRLEPDIGLSAGRNALLNHIETPYFVLCDDDFVFGPRTKIEDLLTAAERYDLDILAGRVLERGRSSGWAAFLAVEGDALVSNGVPRGYVGKIPLFRCRAQLLPRTHRVRARRRLGRTAQARRTHRLLPQKQSSGTRLRSASAGRRPPPSRAVSAEYPSALSRARARGAGDLAGSPWSAATVDAPGRNEAAAARLHRRHRTVRHALLDGHGLPLLPNWVIRGEQDPDLFGARQPAHVARALRRIEHLARIGEGFLADFVQLCPIRGIARSRVLRAPGVSPQDGPPGSGSAADPPSASLTGRTLDPPPRERQEVLPASA